MSGYIPDPNDATQPTDPIIAETAAAEFRALKAKVNTLSSGVLQGSGLQNILTNGDFAVNQLNGSNTVNLPTIGGPEYFSDMWNSGAGAIPLNVLHATTIVETSPGFSPPPNYRSYQSFAIVTPVATIGANGFFEVCQYVEGINMRHMGFGAAGARASTVLFYARSSVANIPLAGTLRNAANTRSFPFSFTTAAANVWQRYAIPVSGDTVGGIAAWPGGIVESAQITFTLASDAVYRAVPGAWRAGNFIGTTTPVNSNFLSNAANNTLDFAGVEWRPGTYGVGNPIEIVPFQLSVFLCRRYYYTDQIAIPGGTVGWVSFGTEMRKSPLITASPVTFTLTSVSPRTVALLNNAGSTTGSFIADARLEVT